MTGAPLAGVMVVSLAVNVPGPVAVFRLREFGARVTKVEPPGGDPLRRSASAWYDELHEEVEVIRLDLKDPEERSGLEGLLATADLLLTSSRPAALQRLGLGWRELHERHPHLSQVAIVGHPAPDEDRPGHDLTYLAEHGLLEPEGGPAGALPKMPRTLAADLTGAERAASAALGLLLARERGGERGGECNGGPGYAEVSLVAAAGSLAAPLRHGLTEPGGVLGGGLPQYGVYETAAGRVALAALEPHFADRLQEELGLKEVSREKLESIFRSAPAAEWEEWAAARDLPLVALR